VRSRGEEPEVFEDVVSEVVRLIDDEHGLLFGFDDEPGDLGADGARCAGPVALCVQAELPGDALVHIHDVAGRQGDVEQAIEAGVQCGGDLAADGGFAGADLAGEQADALELEQVVDPGLGLGGGGGVEQLVGLEVVVEGEAG
jgi:hypothetical protein